MLDPESRVPRVLFRLLAVARAIVAKFLSQTVEVIITLTNTKQLLRRTTTSGVLALSWYYQSIVAVEQHPTPGIRH